MQAVSITHAASIWGSGLIMHFPSIKESASIKESVSIRSVA